MSAAAPPNGGHGQGTPPAAAKLSMVENFIISIGASFASKVLTVGPMYRKELAQVRPELARMGHTPPGAFSWPQLAAIALESLKFVPAQASNLVLKDFVGGCFPASKSDSRARSIARTVLVGGVVGSASLILTYPLTVWTTRARVGLPLPPVLESYTGLGLSVAGIFLYRSLYFGLYEAATPLVRDQGLPMKFLVGYGVTNIAALLTFPLDTLRQRMIVAPAMYRGAWDCLERVVEEESVACLFHGFGWNILRSMLAAGLLVVFDTAKGAYVQAKRGPTGQQR